ncbi:serine hydrolase domain-containing protein [Nonomuraea sp. NPDC050404]|uniref:serine hydrolase domain-containing protein n=1 Tax=Nonomuraea sp. NPDC050404 TaxID=3155783 RepID=UPI003405A7D1
MKRNLIALLTAIIVGLVLLSSPGAAAQQPGLDRRELRQSLNAVHEAGMYGTYSHVTDGRQSWKGAAGVADVETRRPVRPDMRHRIGSVTKTFTATAVLRQVGRGAIELDAPIGRYLPDLVPGELGQRITVRMLLNHTSHLADYDSLIYTSIQSFEDNRFRTYRPRELVDMALGAPATGQPGVLPGSYSNTNYIIAGLLLEKVTGVSAERAITDQVIRKAGLRHTSFPRTPVIPGPHSKAYLSLYGLIDPPKDFSVYDNSAPWTAGGLVSTMEDVNRFYRALLRGELLDAGLLAEMRKVVPVAPGAGVTDTFDYGLGIYPVDLPCGRFWGHSGGVIGMLTEAYTGPDGERQVSIGFNLVGYQRLDENGNILPSPIDEAILRHIELAACGTAGLSMTEAKRPFAFDRIQIPRR